MNQNILNQAEEFNTVLKRLNPAQKEAVVSISGPVMVLAGPGTGKTQILASRIGYILKETDTAPHEILCMTFTEAGAIAMRKRLIQFIGPTAHQIGIFTFHAFCNKVIQDNPEFFRRADLEPVGDLEKLEILGQIIADLPRNSKLINYKSDGSSERKALGDLFELMKRENMSVKEIHDLAKSRRTEIRETDEFRYKRKSGDNQAGDLKMKDIERIDKQLDRLDEAASLYNTYDQLMAKNARYDFSDMILWVIELFQTNNDLLQNYQERYQYILVDEYQDTNGSQNTILSLLCSYWSAPNVFVVGDDDQSIFRFQGAQIENILAFAKKYENDLRTTVLLENYRSTQVILDVAASLISHNSDRLVDSLEYEQKILQANSTAENSPVTICEAFNPVHESLFVGDIIIELISSGVAHEDIAVIYRKHAQVEELAHYLKSKNQPVFLKKRENALDNPSVVQIISVLEWIEKENKTPFSGDEMLFTMLHSEAFGLSPIEIAVFSHWAYRKQRGQSWRLLFSKQNTDETEYHHPDIKIRNRLIEAHNKFENWLILAQNSTIQTLIENIIQDLELMKTINETSSYFDLECVRTFFDFAKTESTKSGGILLSELLIKIDLMNAHFIGLSKERVLYDENGINLMTAHASKGLEFKHVFVIGCTAKDWEKFTPRLPMNLSQILGSPDQAKEIEESRRLLYVAMTRAKETLTISFSGQDINGKEASKSQFLDEISDHDKSHLNSINYRASDSKIMAWNTTRMTTQDSIDFELLDAPILDSYLSNYVLSVTHLNNYLQCPTAFYFENVLRVPAAKNKYMSYGTAVHKALDRLIKLTSENIENLSLDLLLEAFNSSMYRERASFTAEEYKKFKWMGEEHLTSFFTARKDDWTNIKNVLSEVTIDHVQIEGVPIKGQLDRVEIQDNSVHVIDFKTGNPQRGKKKMQNPVENADESDYNKAYGGDYWRQIVFYAHLVNNKSDVRWKMLSGAMEFIEPTDKGEHQIETLYITDEDLKFVANQINTVYQNIQNRIFTPGCGKEDCRWCQFTGNANS